MRRQQSSCSRDEFTELFVCNQHRIYAFIVTMAQNRDEAEEIFQNTSLVLWKKWNECGPPDNFFGWSCGVARNLFRNLLRTNRSSRLRLSEDVALLVAESREKTDELLEIRSQFLALCLTKLPDEQRQLIERYYLQGESIKDIAEEMGISAAALTMRLQRIRKTLFECIDVSAKDQGGAK